mmetsp:Transcript_3552/g.9548  ORF Transcript_3552/g.9548 Transcript_3552/m.9548 type:complete len:129 (-) Transcript_3552:12-398(-)
MAPELFGRQEGEDLRRYDAKADVYSYAMVLSELLTDRLPFFGTSVEVASRPKVVVYVLGGGRPQVSPVCGTPPVLVQLMLRSWGGDPAERPTFEGICAELAEELDAMPSREASSCPTPSAIRPRAGSA